MRRRSVLKALLGESPMAKSSMISDKEHALTAGIHVDVESNLGEERQFPITRTHVDQCDHDGDLANSRFMTRSPLLPAGSRQRTAAASMFFKFGDSAVGETHAKKPHSGEFGFECRFVRYALKGGLIELDDLHVVAEDFGTVEYFGGWPGRLEATTSYVVEESRTRRNLPGFAVIVETKIVEGGL